MFLLEWRLMHELCSLHAGESSDIVRYQQIQGEGLLTRIAPAFPMATHARLLVNFSDTKVIAGLLPSWLHGDPPWNPGKESRLEVLEVFPWLLGKLGRERSEGLVEVWVVTFLV